MINNRQAGRRRGRNNPRPNGGGNRGNGGDSGNRIDNRARGNAAQLLEKYRNMARDAQLAGDRVNMEYYLQFADHYFRVLADNRARQEENQNHGHNQQRFRSYEEDGQDDEFGTNDDGFGDIDGNRPDYGRRDDSRREEGRRDEARRDDNRRDEGRREDNRREEGRRDEMRGNGNRRPPRDRAVEESEGANEPVMTSPVVEAANDESGEAPRRERAPRTRKPRRETAEVEAGNEPGLDTAALPPAIGRAPAAEEEGEPAPRRPRRPRAPAQAAE